MRRASSGLAGTVGAREKMASPVGIAAVPLPLAPSPRGGARVLLLASLSLLSMISPFATDMYLPSLPRMADDLSTAPSGVQLTLTTFLVGVALGQLFFGP